MEKFLLTIEFRYEGIPTYDDGYPAYLSKKITLGVFDTRDEANIAGNKAMEVFEAHFKLNPNYNHKDRFSNNGGPLGFPKDLITNLGYLKTPFEFYAKITKLIYADVDQSITEVMEVVEKYKQYKQTQQED